MTPLDAIICEFLDEHGWPRKTPLSREQVRQWFQSDDLEVLGAARHLLERKGGFTRVEPPLTPQEKRLFLSRYFERVLSKDEEDEEHQGQVSQWIDSGFDLSHDLVYWSPIFCAMKKPHLANAKHCSLGYEIYCSTIRAPA